MLLYVCYPPGDAPAISLSETVLPQQKQVLAFLKN
jgi:hypothetical protein